MNIKYTHDNSTLAKETRASGKRPYYTPMLRDLDKLDGTEFKTIISPSEHATINNSFGPS